VQSSVCASCGATLPAGAQFCAYCGSAVTAPPAPLASAATPPPAFAPPPPAAWTTSPPPPARRRASRVLLVIVVFLVVIILVGVVAFAFFLPTAPTSPISVPALVVYSPDNVCGLNSNPIYYLGFNSSLSGNVSVGLYLPNYNTTTCTVHRLVTNTTGFTLTEITMNGGPLPGSIAGSPSTSSPNNGTVEFNILTPATSYSGNVSLIFY